MVTAAFRFYGELNDFLAPMHRNREFEETCARSATTKHMIEALGVPHTEVGRVTVNHADAGLSRLIGDGDHIGVYPVLPENGQGVQSDSHDDVQAGIAPRFLADAHLGGLGRLLRMAGFDTLYDNHFADDDIVEIAKMENRVVLTRDRELLKRRELTLGCYIRSTKPPEQLRQAAGRFGLAYRAAPFTICLHCNRPLREVEKASVCDRLPPSVQTGQAEFSTCDCCGRIYWKGTHWRRMRAMLDEIVLSPPG